LSDTPWVVFTSAGKDPETGLGGHTVKPAFAAAFSIAILGFAGGASAADLPSQAPPPVARVVPAWNINWTGVYAGFNGGYGFARTVDIPGATSGNDSNIDGALAGGQWQHGSFVAGAEGDFQWAWQQRAITGTAAGVGFTADERVRWFGTARLRAGFAFERSLLYVTGGGAYVNLKVSGSSLGVSVNDQVSHAAWTAAVAGSSCSPNAGAPRSNIFKSTPAT
jgi:outer membrane immunogenic protein